MGFFDFIKSKDSNEMSLEEQLNANLLSNEIQANMYNEARNLKQYGDQFARSQSQEDAIAYQQAVIKAIDSSVEVYEWLKERGIFELNGVVLVSSFYLVNLSDVTFKDPASFSDREITNMVDSFLSAVGAQDKVDTSSYSKLIRVGVNWLLKHPVN